MTYTTIQRWGNSQGVRLSRSVLTAASLRENDHVEVAVQHGVITIRKARKYKSLEALFDGYQGEIPEMVDMGEDVGLEVLE